MSHVGENELTEATFSWDTPKLQLLVENGADPNSRTSKNGFSLLHFAVGHGDENLVLFLLQNNADPNIRDTCLLSPVHLSVHWDFDVILRHLLLFGGDPYLCDISGKSSFEIASEEKSLKCLKVLENFHIPNSDLSISEICSYQSTISSRVQQDTTLNQAFINESPHKDLGFNYTLISEGDVNGIPSVEYLYEDKEKNVKFKESHISGRSTSSSSSSTLVICKNNEIFDMDSTDELLLVPKTKPFSVPVPANDKHDINVMSNSEIRSQLIKLGKNPGPVTADTCNIYLKQLAKLKSANEKPVEDFKPVCTPTCQKTPQYLNGQLKQDLKKNSLLGYPEELRAFVLQPQIAWQDKFLIMEKELFFDFEQPTIKWREGNQKTAFNYLLLDSRLTKGITSYPVNPSNQLDVFVRAIFYVGKGSRYRPLSHLYEAATALKLGREKLSCAKVMRICEIWQSGHGVVNLHCFQNVIPAEAYTRESLIICALGLRNLTNVRRGECYGSASKWSLKKKRQFGSFLLYRALQLLIHDGERQIRLADINTK